MKSRKKQSVEQGVPGYGPQVAAMHTPPHAANLFRCGRGPIQNPDVRRKPRKGTRMKPGRMVSWVGGLTGYVVILCTAQAQTPDIVEFQGGGNLVWTNSNTNLYYQIQWAPSLSGTNPWMSSYRTLTDIRSSSAMVTNPVPMFYRVVGSSNVASRVSKTGQTTSFRTGDDGYYQAGVAPASPRFTDNGNGTVFDNQTGLMWALDANMAGTNNTWDAAIDYCNDLVHGDHDDWRLPNVNELLSLIDHNPEEGWRYPQLPIGHPFLNVQTMPAYWSSTCGEDFIMGVESYYVYIGSGSAAQGEWTTDYAGCVWPVRGGR